MSSLGLTLTLVVLLLMVLLMVLRLPARWARDWTALSVLSPMVFMLNGFDNLKVGVSYSSSSIVNGGCWEGILLSILLLLLSLEEDVVLAISIHVFRRRIPLGVDSSTDDDDDVVKIPL